MPSITEHEAKYKHNRDFVDFLRGNDTYADWFIVACFYSALHIVHSCLHSEMNVTDSMLEDHTTTKETIKKHFSSIDSLYAMLLSLSYTARYQKIGELCSTDTDKAERCLQGIIDECNSLRKSKQRSFA